jgi:hypothetical protein
MILAGPGSAPSKQASAARRDDTRGGGSIVGRCGDGTAGRASLALAVVVALTLVPCVALAAPPTTTHSVIGSLGDDCGIPGATGWWIDTPLITMNCSQDGTLYYSWDSGTVQATAVTAGAGVQILADEGDHTLVAYSVNSSGETETPAGVWQRFLTDSVAPLQPGGLHADAVSGAGVVLGWTASSDAVPGSGLAHYRIYRTTGAPPSVWSPSMLIETLGPGVLAWTDTSPGTLLDNVYAVEAVDAAGNASPVSEYMVSSSLLPVYRFYNFRTGTHFYTANAAEKTYVEANLGAYYRYEGVAYDAMASPAGATPLYRFYNFRTGTHFYTASLAEKQHVESTLWAYYRYEGIAYWVSLDPAGTVPVYRFYNFRQGTHFYTASAAEKANVEATLGSVYTYEGVAFYVLR